MEAAVEALEITKRGMKVPAKEAGVKASASKSTVFLVFLVGVSIDRCNFKNKVSNVHSYS